MVSHSISFIKKRKTGGLRRRSGVKELITLPPCLLISTMFPDGHNLISSVFKLDRTRGKLSIPELEAASVSDVYGYPVSSRIIFFSPPRTVGPGIRDINLFLFFFVCFLLYPWPSWFLERTENRACRDCRVTWRYKEDRFSRDPAPWLSMFHQAFASSYQRTTVPRGEPANYFLSMNHYVSRRESCIWWIGSLENAVSNFAYSFIYLFHFFKLKIDHT